MLFATYSNNYSNSGAITTTYRKNSVIDKNNVCLFHSGNQISQHASMLTTEISQVPLSGVSELLKVAK